jgi:flagellar biosynthetic protein FliR
MNLLDYTLSQFSVFLLVLVRTSGLMFTAPFFGSRNNPPQVVTALCFLLALVLTPLVGGRGFVLPPNLGLFFAVALAELGVGMILGFAAGLLFAGAQLGGLLVDNELGLGLANIIDPTSNEQVSLVGQMKLFMALLFFLVLNGHHLLIRALVRSFDLIPFGAMSFGPPAALHLGDTLAARMFEVAVQVAAPAVVAVFVSTIALAFAARAVPEMNIFVVGFSVRIAVGLLLLLLAIPAIAWVFQGLHARWLGPGLERVLNLLAG